ncbi:MAG TPA: lasso peptide biosynthesis B2 protein [Longimicrobium sp.]|nr:lasso peptide biosynthesis B2 protein [Longimicrobium sp.]
MSGLDLPFGETGPVEVTPVSSAREALRTVAGLWLLVLMDLALRVAGFDRFYRLVAGWPTLAAGRAGTRPEVWRETAAAVDRARIYYFKHAWCLQRAAATVCYLRLRGVRAELVIGVRKIPFFAHAWTEVEGTVVNEAPAVRARYQEITRC